MKPIVAALTLVLSSACFAQAGLVPRLLRHARPSHLSLSEPPSPVELPITIVGKVVHVEDGDTLTALDGQNRQWVIRMTDIDAPEMGHGKARPGQSFSRRSREFLASLVAGQVVTNECHDVDRRIREDGSTKDRYICRVFVGTSDINKAMVAAGMAFANRQHKRYVRDPQVFSLEDGAKRDRRGLWAAPPIEPWVWRSRCWQQGQCADVAD